MDSSDRERISHSLNLLLVKICASDFGWARRERFYWLDWKITSQDGVRFDMSAEFTTISCQVQKHPLQSFLDKDSIKVDPSQPFPTLTRPIPRSKPPFRKAGVSQCDPLALQRWEKDQFRFPPYVYLEKHLIRSGNSLRLPSIEEKERLLGFPSRYTHACLPKTQRRGQVYLDVRGGLLGNTWSVPVVMSLLQELAVKLDLCPPRSLVELMSLWAPIKTYSAPPVPGDSQKLAQLIVQNCSFKGTDVKLTPDSMYSPSVWPRKPIKSSLWKWKVVGSWKFNHAFGPEHINVLEMRAFLSTLKWRTRSVSGLRCRFLHIMDSQVCLGILAKGRTSSNKMSSVSSQVAALLLASQSLAFTGWVQTDDNPADKPSRVKMKLRRWRRKR